MSRYEVTVTRSVRLVVDADSDKDAPAAALDIAWGWLPECAAGGDQGSAEAYDTRLVEL